MSQPHDASVARAPDPAARGCVRPGRGPALAGYFADIDAGQLPTMIDAIGIVLAELERASGFSPAFTRDQIAKKAAST